MQDPDVLMDAMLTQLKGSPVQTILLAVIAGYILQSIMSWWTSPKNQPPFYYEFPYIPWLGSLVQFAVNPRELIQRATEKMAAQNKQCFTVQLFGTPMTFLTGSEGHAHFFKQREHVFDIRPAYGFTTITFGPDVCYDCPQNIMAQQFAFFKDGLNDECFIKYMELVQEEVEIFFKDRWGDSGEADLLQTLSDLFTLTSSRCLLGDEIRSRWKDSGMAEHYLALDHSFVPILFFFPSIPNPHKSKCLKARELFKSVFQDIIQARRDKAANDPNYKPPQDSLQVMMEAKYKDGRPLTMTEITGIMIGILLGGQHTSNVTGTWCLSHLLKEPKWMEKLMEEQRTMFSGSTAEKPAIQPARLMYEQVQKMQIFDQVLSETLRLHPPFFQLSRKVMQDTPFQDTVIPKGHIVNISPAASHRNPALWDDPHTFDPTRFDPAKKDEIKPFAWIPFGGGMHQCGGRKFAWNSLKVTLSWLLRNYELELVGAGAKEFPPEDFTTMVVAPSSRHTRVKYTRRRY